jgi:aspartate aminotransferase
MKKLRNDNGLTYQPGQIVVSVGAKHALYNAFQVLCQAGDEVIPACPILGKLLEQIKLSGAVPVVVRQRHPTALKCCLPSWKPLLPAALKP